MRHRFDIRITAAALSVALGATPALAQGNWGAAFASADLGPLVVQLTPLPGQLTPWVDFNLAYQPANNNFTKVEAQAVTLPGQDWETPPIVSGPFEPQTVGDDSFQAAGLAIVSGNGTVPGTVFTAHAYGNSGDVMSWFMAGVNGSYTGYGAWFSLSPHTELVISGTGKLRVLANGGNEAGVSDSNAYAHAWISFTGPAAYGGGGSQSDTAFVSLAGNSYYGSLPFDQALEQPLQISFVNGTDTPMQARFEFSVYAAGMANPVPEPASWALMLGGLALVGAALRRR